MPREPMHLWSRLLLLVLIFISFPVILAIDQLVAPWRVPAAILYSIPIMASARLFKTNTAILVTVVAFSFSLADAWLAGIDPQTAVIASGVLVLIGLLSIMWSRSEERLAIVIEERSYLYSQERQRTVELEEANARLLDFFSTVAHDLRSPLTIISGYSQMLSRNGAIASERRDQLIGGIQRSVEHMVRLTDDLLDASRIGSGRLEIRKSQCDLVALIRDAVLQRQPLHPSHRLLLEVGEPSIEISCDADRLSRAIGNLLDNAIKYSPQGGEVRARVARAGAAVRLAISDQGIGIELKDLPKLFQPYVRLRQATEARGMGLGLYIVKGIVQAHGGEITVESEVGKGSTFTIELPLVDPS